MDSKENQVKNIFNSKMDTDNKVEDIIDDEDNDKIILVCEEEEIDDDDDDNNLDNFGKGRWHFERRSR